MTPNVLVSDREYQPTWDIVKLFPAQGQWSEEEYLALETNRLIEYTFGKLEVLDLPTQAHQFILLFLYRTLWTFVTQNDLGIVVIAPMPVKLYSGKFREPDIVFLFAHNNDQRKTQFWTGADLVMEIVSPDDPKRDYVTKREEYAQAGISEYWIVDNRIERVSVLTLKDDHYVEHGEFTLGQKATSPLLTGFEVDVTAVFAAGRQ